jgi:arylformamidase
MDAQFVEREYNNRAMVPDHPAIFSRWEKDSQFVRGSLRGHVDIPYGSDARHRIDIFPAENARGLLVFIHGGYWRSLDKSMFSWLAASWVAAGVSVAAPNYRLAPSVAIDAIVDDAIAAMNFLVRKGPSYGASADRIVVSGHSAGGHLAAALLAAPLSRLQFDATRIIGAVPISGVFDFEPLLLHAFNADFKLTPESARALSLHDKKPTVAAPLVIAAGALESSEFRRQSRILAESPYWKPQVKALQILPGLNHFTIVDAFAERGQPLYEATLGLFR